MSDSRQKALAFTLLCLLIGVVHFFFGRKILSALLYITEIGLFWIIGAVIALGIIFALFELIFGEAALDKAEKWIVKAKKWIDKKLGLDKDCKCNCEACDCCECECECEEDDECDRPCCDECVSECAPDAEEET